MYTVNAYIVVEGKKFYFRFSKDKTLKDYDEAKRELKRAKDSYKYK